MTAKPEPAKRQSSHLDEEFSDFRQTLNELEARIQQEIQQKADQLQAQLLQHVQQEFNEVVRDLELVRGRLEEKLTS